MHCLSSTIKTLILLVVLGLVVPLTSSAQQVVAHHQNVWLDLSLKHKFSEKQSVSGLVSLRRNDFVADWQQSLVRINFNHKLSDNFTGTLGYDFAINFPYGQQAIDERFFEHRVVEQVSLKNTVSAWRISHRYRLEHRFLMLDETSLRNRFRYKLGLSHPLSIKGEKTPWSFTMFNELFVHLRKTNPAHYFDQNWAYGGLDYMLTKHVSVSVGYMNQYLTKPDGIRTENNHTLIVGLKRK